MTEAFFCVDCEHIGPLNVHLRCFCCDSDSVVPAFTGPEWYDQREVKKLIESSVDFSVE